MKAMHRHSPFLLVSLAAIVIAAVAGLADSAAGANPVLNSARAYDYIVSNYNSTCRREKDRGGYHSGNPFEI
ncbi:MAG: hypothetical protein ACK41Q_07905 [Candidatus Brocadia sp.]